MYGVFTYIYHKNQMILEMKTWQLEEIIQGLAENSWGLSSSSSFSPSSKQSIWPVRASSTVWREHSTARSSANSISCPKRWVVAEEPLGPVGSGT